MPNTDPESFVALGLPRYGGQKRANYALFLSKLYDILGVLAPIRRAMINHPQEFKTCRFADFTGKGD